ETRSGSWSSIEPVFCHTSNERAPPPERPGRAARPLWPARASAPKRGSQRMGLDVEQAHLALLGRRRELDGVLAGPARRAEGARVEGLVDRRERLRVPAGALARRLDDGVSHAVEREVLERVARDVLVDLLDAVARG